MPPTQISLLQFLKHAVQISCAPHGHHSPIYVLGNPSADLDSIISAILYSYIASTAPEGRGRQYVPVVNLAGVRSGGELQRLRPEFATALRLATRSGRDSENIRFEENLLTIADIKDRFRSKDKTGTEVKAGSNGLDVVMVDWNAIPGASPSKNEAGFVSCEYEGMSMSVLGCIDHHQDENFIPLSRKTDPDTEPHCVQTGVGSCTSLVILELRSRNLWMDVGSGDAPTDTGGAGSLTSPDAHSQAQAAKLAMASILIDTVNMTDENKVSDVDRSAVSFLEEKIQDSRPAEQNKYDERKVDRGWDRQSFYEEVLRAKTNSVDNLTMDETLGRDYKEWTETLPSGKTVKIGFCGVVKPLSWMLRKAAKDRSSSRTLSSSPSSLSHSLHPQPPEFLSHDLLEFSKPRQLDVVVVMTSFVGPPPNKEFNRELLVWDINDGYKPDMERFEATAIDDLSLVPWQSDQENAIIEDSACDGTYGNRTSGFWRVWKQRDVSKSRKQVAPLMRNIMAGK